MLQEFEGVVSDTVETYFDPESQIAYVIYRGDLGADASMIAYDWLFRLFNTFGVENIYGEIFDFRNVNEFLPENLANARKASRRLNVAMDTSRLPAVLIVGNSVQEEFLRGPMRNSPDNPRKRIVHSEDEAFAFIDAFQSNHG